MTDAGFRGRRKLLSQFATAGKCYNNWNKNQETVINLGETQALTEGDIQHNISIYLLELSRVRMKLDRQKSEWMEIDGEFNHSSGLRITIEDISFQPYQGGTKIVTYIVK